MEASARSVLLLLVLGSVFAGYISAAGVNFECPSFDPTTCLHSKPVQPECRNDKDCTGRMKCCCSDCGWKCVSPPVQLVKNGRCPPKIQNCTVPVPTRCSKDVQCQGQKKCCKLCSNECVPPRPEPAGVCPKNDGEGLSDLQCSSVKCSGDSDCGPDEICCISGGEQKCVKPVVS